MDVTRSTPLTDFPGVGEARAKKLEKLGLTAAGDLLAWYPLCRRAGRAWPPWRRSTPGCPASGRDWNWSR